MSTLLEQASLVMIPSGYKEDIVYSQIPTNGNGDLSFTRASNGTRVNSAGLVEVCPWNLLQYSEDFANGVWVQDNNIITSNSIIAPNGTTTGETISNSATTALFRTYQYISGYGQPQTLTFSTYFKYKDHRYISFGLTDDSDYRSQVVVDLQNMVITENYKFFSGDVLTSSIENVGNGWYRIVGTFTYNTALAGGNLYLLYKFQTSGTFSSLGTFQTGTGVYIWGAQLNIGSTAKPYFPTTDRLNVPRLTYQNGGGGCPSLLLEKQSTNLLSYSEDFSNGYWELGSVATITTNTVVSPDGTQNADTLTANGTGSLFVRRNVYLGTAQTCSNSLFVKKANNRYVGFRNSGTVSNHDVFDFDTKTWTNNSGATLSYDEFPNGWFRLKSTNTDAVNLNYYWSVIPAVNTSGVESTTASNLSVYIWGGQAEQNSSYVSSYIPTTSSSATRVADYAYKTSATALIGQSEGTLFADFVTGGLPSIDQYYMNISDGTTSNIVYIGFYSNILVARVIDAGSLVVNINVALATNTRYKVGFSYKANDCILYINGSNSGSDTSASIPACSKLSYNDFSNEACYQLNESVLFKTRLTNAELQAITTI